MITPLHLTHSHLLCVGVLSFGSTVRGSNTSSAKFIQTTFSMPQHFLKRIIYFGLRKAPCVLEESVFEQDSQTSSGETQRELTGVKINANVHIQITTWKHSIWQMNKTVIVKVRLSGKFQNTSTLRNIYKTYNTHYYNSNNNNSVSVIY